MNRCTELSHRRWRRSVLRQLLLGLCCAGCLCSCASAPREAAPAEGSDALWRRIEAEVGDAACSKTEHCQSAAVGDKPCGGPEGYLAWSSQRSDRQRLSALLDAYRGARRAENLKSGMASNCMFISDPGAQCLAGHCRLREAGSASGPGRAD